MLHVMGSMPVLLAMVLVGVNVVATVGCADDSAPDAYGESRAVSLTDDSVTVEMNDMSFEPQGIRVRPATKVTWVNNDPVFHNVRQVESTFLSPDVNQGETYAFTLDEAGRYRYQCTYHHPNMKGIVIVEG